MSRMKEIRYIVGYFLIVLVLITPMVLGATWDTVTVTFDPTGNIDLDVAPETAAIGSITAGSSAGTGAADYTLYNNGTVTMDTQIKTNSTTDSASLTLDPDGSPTEDNYSIQTSGNCPNQYITSSNVAWKQDLSGGSSETFGFTVYLGTISQDWPSQTTTVNISGSISS